METQEKCPECGSAWSNGITCRAHFEQMLAWELEYDQNVKKWARSVLDALKASGQAESSPGKRS